VTTLKRPSNPGMWNLLRNEVSNSQSHSLGRENGGKSAFRERRIVLLVLSATILVFLHGTIGASTAAITHVVQFQTTDSRSGLPSDWSLQKYRGTPSFNIYQNELPPHLKMISSGETAFGLRKEIYVDIQAYPYLYWSWKATKLPDGGDIRKKDKDDQSIQIYLTLQIPGEGASFRHLRRLHIYGITKRQRIPWSRVPRQC